MAILVTGGTGNTGTVVIKHLVADNASFFIASRRGAAGAPSPALEKHMVKFDYADQSTWEPALSNSIKAVYIVMPQMPEPEKAVRAFIDVAVKAGVKRFVTLGGTSAKKGGFYAGQVWQHLDDVSKTSGIEYSMVNPTWFIDNLAMDSFALRPYIRKESTLYSATKGVKIPFVAVTDIGEVAYRALTSEKPLEQELTVLGLEKITFEELAGKIGSALGREIKFKEVDDETRTKQYMECGLPKEFAGFLTYLEGQKHLAGDPTAKGIVESVCGRKPVSVESWLAEHKDEIM